MIESVNTKARATFTTPLLITERLHVEVGDLLVIPGTTIRFDITEVRHGFYSSQIVYDRFGVMEVASLTDDDMLQVMEG